MVGRVGLVAMLVIDANAVSELLAADVMVVTTEKVNVVSTLIEEIYVGGMMMEVVVLLGNKVEGTNVFSAGVVDPVLTKSRCCGLHSRSCQICARLDCSCCGSSGTSSRSCWFCCYDFWSYWITGSCCHCTLRSTTVVVFLIVCEEVVGPLLLVGVVVVFIFVFAEVKGPALCEKDVVSIPGAAEVVLIWTIVVLGAVETIAVVVCCVVTAVVVGGLLVLVVTALMRAVVLVVSADVVGRVLLEGDVVCKLGVAKVELVLIVVVVGAVETVTVVNICCGITSVVFGLLVVVDTTLVGAVVVFLDVSVEVMGPVLFDVDVGVCTLGVAETLLVWITVVVGEMEIVEICDFCCVVTAVVGGSLVFDVFIKGVVVIIVVSAEVVGPVLLEAGVVVCTVRIAEAVLVWIIVAVGAVEMVADADVCCVITSVVGDSVVFVVIVRG